MNYYVRRHHDGSVSLERSPGTAAADVIPYLGPTSVIESSGEEEKRLHQIGVRPPGDVDSFVDRERLASHVGLEDLGGRQTLRANQLVELLLKGTALAFRHARTFVCGAVTVKGRS